MKASLTLPILLIIAGTIWLLRSLDLFPATNDIIAVILATVGILIFILEGINKSSIISAPMLVYLGGSIYAYYHYPFKLSTLIAAGMIFSGCLMILARSDIIPLPRSQKQDLQKK